MLLSHASRENTGLNTSYSTEVTCRKGISMKTSIVFGKRQRRPKESLFYLNFWVLWNIIPIKCILCHPIFMVKFFSFCGYSQSILDLWVLSVSQLVLVKLTHILKSGWYNYFCKPSSFPLNFDCFLNVDLSFCPQSRERQQLHFLVWIPPRQSLWVPQTNL